MKERLNGMRVFAQVVEARSFSAAADKLGMSKSLASRHVSALERSLAVKLLNRTTAQAFAVRHVLPALPEFTRRYPKIRIRLSCGNRALDLGDEGFDLGIRVSFGPAPDLVARKLAANRSVVCASPDYLKRRGTPRRIEDLARHDCVLFPPLAPNGRWSLRRDGRRHAVRVAGVLETDEMETVRAAVAAGLGIGILPLYMVGDALRQGELVPLLRPYRVVPESAIYLVYLPNATLPSRVRALIDFLVGRFAPVPAWETGW
jgi:DNA-binding transcriptional LysR family regulator